METQKNGGYDAEGVIWHQHSNKLMVEILKQWPNKAVPVIDLGCGHNFYGMVLKYLGYNAIGVDAAPLRAVDIVTDITDKPMLQSIFGLLKRNVISLEVGEHIPAEKADDYLDSITMFSGDIIMSWAVIGQAGVGHINCQNNEWVIKKMYLRGYKLSEAKTAALRASVIGCHCSWFINTLMYFSK